MLYLPVSVSLHGYKVALIITFRFKGLLMTHIPELKLIPFYFWTRPPAVYKTLYNPSLE